MTRPFRFGVTLERTSNQDEIAGQARRAEDLGYSCMVMTDHFDDRNAPLVTITAAALATTSLRVGTLVLCNDYRHPVVLAKELATLDRMSNGRLEVGVGAGWMTSDYEQAGLPMDRPGVRIERLGEAVSVLEGCFTDGPFDFAGDHYTITGLDAQPKPTQRPRPPLLLAGGGRKMLTLAAQRADIIAVNISLHTGVVDERVAAGATAEATDDKVALVRGCRRLPLRRHRTECRGVPGHRHRRPPLVRRGPRAWFRAQHRAGAGIAPRPVRDRRRVRRHSRGEARALGLLVRDHPSRSSSRDGPRRRTPNRPLAPTPASQTHHQSGTHTV